MITPAEFLKWSQVFGLVSGGGGGGASVTPRQVQESAFNTNYASGVDDAFIVNLNPPPSDLDPTDGMLLMMSSGSLSNYTTNPTIQLNDQPSQRIIRTVDGFVLPLDIQPDNTYLFVFSAAQGIWILINPSISNAQTRRVQQNLYNFTPDVGTPDNYIGSLFPDPPTNFSVGMAVYLLANNNNTGASTLTLNGITKDIRLQVAYEGSFDLQANMIQEDQLYIFLFDALTDSWVLVNPSLPYNLPLSGGTMAGDINTDGNKVTGLPLPIDASDAATKSYVDDKAAGNIAACNLATTGNLSGYVYDNGTAGVGATLTAGSNGALSVDGVTVVLGYRILVPNQTNEAENGVYEVTQVGDVSNPAILTRATDYDEPSEIVAGSEARVVGGNTLAATTWMMTQTDVIIVGTTAITFIESSPSTNSFVTVSTNQTVTGLKTFTQPLDLVNPYMIVGTSRTDAANKVWRPQIPNYNLADGYFVPFFSSATSVQNTVSIGGGTSLGNAASVITFFSAPNITTPTGTQIADITYSGFRLGAGSRVNSISNDNTMAAASSNNLFTGLATKNYIDSKGLKSVQVFTSSGTWNKPSGIRKVIIEAVGGGAGGAGVAAILSQPSVASGGGSGSYVRKLVDVSAINSLSVTVGAGGSGGSAGPFNGEAGEASSFGTHATAGGGYGGIYATSSLGVVVTNGGQGGISSGGDINYRGNAGGTGYMVVLSSRGVGWGGRGAFSYLCGSPASDRMLNTSGGGIAGLNSGSSSFGVGGGGAVSYNDTTDQPGGDGGHGVVIVWEYA